MKHPYFLILVLLPLLSCKKEDINITLCNPEAYFPLETGNYWVYNTFRKFDNGTIEYRETDSLYISSDTLMLGYRFHHLEGSFNAHAESAWLTSKEGRIISSDQNVFYECPRLFDSKELYPVAHFDYPALLNTIREDTTISLPAGDFNPVMLMEARSMVEDSIWVVTYRFFYARNVGLIRFVARSRSHDFEGIMELIRYHVD